MVMLLVAWEQHQVEEEGENSMLMRMGRMGLTAEHMRLFSSVVVAILVVEAHQWALGLMGRLVELKDSWSCLRFA